MGGESGPVRFAELTWEEVRELDRPRTVAILPVGAVEAHGPHLPLATDSILADAMADGAAARLAANGIGTVLLPGLPWTAAPFADGFPGTLSIRPEVVSALIVDLARVLAHQEFRALAIANAHLDPAHLASLYAAGETVRAEGRIAWIFPDLTRRPWGGRLGEEFRTGACHAGRYETSVVMAERGELVRESRRAGLAPNPASLSAAIREGKATFEEAGGPEAYFGWPADASADEGRERAAALAGILADAVREALEG